MSSFNKKPTAPDALGEWTVGTDGRQYINLKNGNIFKDGLRQKVDLVLAGKLPQADNEDEQETYNAFSFENQTFSISQFDKGYGLQTLLYKGSAKYPSDKPLINPNAGQQTIEQTSGQSNNTGNNNFNKGGYNKGGYSKGNWKPAAKVAVQNVCQEPEYVLEENLKAACPAGGNKVFFFTAPEKYEETTGKTRCLTGTLVYPA